MSPLHRHVAAQAIQVFLRSGLAEPPKDLHTLLELLRETLTEQGAAMEPAARSSLENAKVSGKTARLVRELFGLKDSPQSANTRDVLRRRSKEASYAQ